MRISELQDGQKVTARLGRAGREAAEFGPWHEVELNVQRTKKAYKKTPAGTVCSIAVKDDPSWASYDPRHDYHGGNLLLAEDYYMEIEGLGGL